MNLLVVAVLVLGIVKTACGLSCYDCSDSNYDGEWGSMGTCFVTSGTTSSTNCSGAVGTEYCLTQFTINDGVATQVTRRCADSGGDSDVNTSGVPGADKCVTTLRTGNPADVTNCYFHCSSGDNCNTKIASGLKSCATTCNRANSGGTCDYVTGTCHCNPGFQGVNCTATVVPAPTALRQCIQCNTETDPGCTTEKTSTDCQATQKYCSTATTTIFDPAGTAKKTVTSRGCTDVMFVVDECTFTDIFTDPPINSADLGYKEVTCGSTCSTNGCNTNNANGVVDGTEVVTMYCVQCDLTTDGYCATKRESARTLCPVGTTHCKATVSYLIHTKTDLSSPTAPVHQMLSVVRECATEAVTKKCTEATFPGVAGVKNVTCTETCDTDGCNDGWPARPKCIVCNSDRQFADGYDECLENPPDAQMCDFPYEAYCIAKETGIVKDNRRETPKGIRRRIERKCSAVDIGGDCSSQTIRNVEVDTCNYTCTSDGCNQGTSGGAVVIQTMLGVMAPAIFGWLMQIYL